MSALAFVSISRSLEFSSSSEALAQALPNSNICTTFCSNNFYLYSCHNKVGWKIQILLFLNKNVNSRIVLLQHPVDICELKTSRSGNSWFGSFLSFTQSMSEYFKLCRKEERESSTFKRFHLDCKITKQEAIIFPKALYKTLHVFVPSQGITFSF